MKRKIFSLVIVALLAISYAFAGGNKKDFAIIYIGNSITYGAMHEQRDVTAPPVYTSQILAKKYKANVIWRNCGWSGATTYDFLPSHKRYFPRVEKAIKEIQAETDAPIVFSIMLGTNVVLYYLPFLLLSGVIAGIAVGIASGLLLKKVTLDLSYVKNSKKTRR